MVLLFKLVFSHQCRSPDPLAVRSNDPSAGTFVRSWTCGWSRWSEGVRVFCLALSAERVSGCFSIRGLAVLSAFLLSSLLARLQSGRRPRAVIASLTGGRGDARRINQSSLLWRCQSGGGEPDSSSGERVSQHAPLPDMVTGSSCPVQRLKVQFTSFQMIWFSSEFRSSQFQK